MKSPKKSITSLSAFALASVIALLAVPRLDAATVATDTTHSTIIARMIPATTSQECDQDGEAEWVEEALAELSSRGIELHETNAIHDYILEFYPQALASEGTPVYNNMWNKNTNHWETVCSWKKTVTLFDDGEDNPIVITIESTMNLDQ